jgi:hypothetical protein
LGTLQREVGMNAFVAGLCLVAAAWRGFDWLNRRSTTDAVLFWLNAVLAVLNLIAWLA